MRTNLIPGRFEGSISKLSCRKHTHLVQLCDWGDEKRCRPNLNQKTESTISLCAGIFFVFSLLLFIVCTIDPSILAAKDSLSSSAPQKEFDSATRWRLETSTESTLGSVGSSSRSRGTALHGMGTVYRRGSKAMNELIVAHVSESTSVEEFRMFMRTLHRSGATARADVVLLFPWSPPPTSMTDVIVEEDVYFQKLILYRSNFASAEFPSTNSSGRRRSNSTLSPFNFNAFKKAAEESDKTVQPLWGWRNSNKTSERFSRLSLPTVWGSVVGFEVSELNPDDTLRGFIDQPPVQLRRWACYQMLLGMVRHKFKHILLTEVGGVLMLRDPLMLARKKGGLYLSLEDRTWGAATSDELLSEAAKSEGENHETAGTENKGMGSELREVQAKEVAGRQGMRRKAMAGLCERVYGVQIWSSLEEVEKQKRLVNSGAIMGGIQQIRGLANAMVIETVKVALERKSRLAFPDNVLLSYLLHKSSVLGKRVVEHLHLMENGDSFVHSLMGSKQQAAFFFKKGRRAAYAMIHCSRSSSTKRWASVVSTVHSDICSSPADAAVYTDCQQISNSNN